MKEKDEKKMKNVRENEGKCKIIRQSTARGTLLSHITLATNKPECVSLHNHLMIVPQ
jgi:hypothetical protein